MVTHSTCGRCLSHTALLAAVVGSAMAAPAHAGNSPWVRFIATELESQPTAIPTQPGSTIDALLQSRISTSRNGQYWAAQVFSLQNAATSRAVISGTRSGNIDFALGRLQTMPGLGVAFESSASGFDAEVLVNDSGDVSISGNLVPTTADEAIVLYRRSNQTFSFVAREGSAIPGITGETFGGSLDQRTLLNNGRVIFRDSGTTGPLGGNFDEFVFMSASADASVPFASVAQSGSLVPTGQSIAPNVPLNDIELGYGVSDDGTKYIVRGILGRAAPNVAVVVNGAIALEQGQALPGSPLPTPTLSTALAITDAGMGPSGDWYITGRALPTGTGMSTAPWLVFNNRIIFTGDNDFPGGLPGERVNALNGISITTRGDLFYSVSTVPNEAGVNRTLGVVIPVVGDAFVVYQSGTPIDFNNNGDPSDDTWFISSVFSAAMADDGTVYLITRYSNIGDVIGYIPVTLPAAGCGPSDVAGPNQVFGADGQLTADDIIVFLSWYFASDTRADVAGANQATTPDGDFSADDIIVFLGRYFAGC